MAKKITTPLDRVLARLLDIAMSEKQLYAETGLPTGLLSHAKKKTGADRANALSLQTLQKIAPAIGMTIGQLLGEETAVTPAAGLDGWARVALAQMFPSMFNPRKSFDQEALEELASSIAQQGLLQNLVVRPTTVDGHMRISLNGKPAQGYEIVSGERRFRALEILCRRGAWDRSAPIVPVQILEKATDAEHLQAALIENLQRQDVNPMEEAEGFLQLQRLNPKLTAAKIAEKIGCTPRHVQQRIALVEKLPEEGKQALREGRITFSQARVITTADKGDRGGLVKRAIDGEDHNQLRETVTRGMAPVSRAIFDVNTAGLRTTTLDNGVEYFVDFDAFKAKQLAAAKKQLQQLRKELPWAELEEGYFYVGWHNKTDDNKKAGAVIHVADDGTVKIYHGLLPQGADDNEPAAKRETKEQKAKREAEERAREEQEQAHELLRERLQEIVAADAALALRLFLLSCLASDDEVCLVDQGDMVGMPKTLFAKGAPLHRLAGLVEDSDEPTFNESDGNSVEVDGWRRLAGETPADLSAAFACRIAHSIQIPRYGALNPALLAIAAEIGAEIPEILLPKQAELEQAKPAKKKAA